MCILHQGLSNVTTLNAKKLGRMKVKVAQLIADSYLFEVEINVSYQREDLVINRASFTY
jgi:hypothetical protein